MRRKYESVAYHEAGHAVAAVLLRLGIGRRSVSIVPEKAHGILGYTHIMARLREQPDCATSEATKSRIEAWAIASLAGDAAELRLDGKRRFGGHQDFRQAIGLLTYISTSFEQHDARIEAARIGAKDLVETNWPAIQTVARELLSEKTLTGAEVRAIVLRCDEEHYAAIDQSVGLV
jgi:ATP-dependent Zn protease